MRRLFFGAPFWMAATFGLAGVNVWTTNAPSGAQAPVLDSATGALYVASSDGLARSDDHGTTWAPACAEAGSSALPLAASAGDLYALGTDKSLYGSRDGGRHCAAVFQNVADPSEYDSVALVVDPFSPTTLYRDNVSTAVNPFCVGLACVHTSSVLTRSVDAGVTWTTLSGDFNGYVSVIAADPGTRGVLYAATNGNILGTGVPTLYRSGDGGSSWSAVSALPGAVYRLSVDPASASTIYADGWRSTDGGATFSLLRDLATSQIVPDPRNRSRLYAATNAQGVLRSDDRGATWNPINAGFAPYDTGIGSLVIEPNSIFLHASTQSGVYDDEVVDPGTLVLNAAHPFSIALSATDQRTGRAGTGVPTPVNDLWGYFSIPAITGNPNNPEVFVKMLDGTAINGTYWFFYGGLTDLEYTLTVTEDGTGRQRTYTKPAGSECGGSDTAAFTP